MYRPKKATWRVNSRSVAIFALMLFLVEYFAVERCITPGEQFETPGTLAGPVKASATCFPSLYHFSARLVWKHLDIAGILSTWYRNGVPVYAMAK